MKCTLSFLLLASSTFIFSAENEQKIDYYDTTTHTFKLSSEDDASPSSPCFYSIESKAKENPFDAEEMLRSHSAYFEEHAKIKYAYLLSYIAQSYFNKKSRSSSWQSHRTCI